MQIFKPVARLTFTAIVAGLTLCAVRSTATPPSGYYLVWSDEFSGSSLDSSK